MNAGLNPASFGKVAVLMGGQSADRETPLLSGAGARAASTPTPSTRPSARSLT